MDWHVLLVKELSLNNHSFCLLLLLLQTFNVLPNSPLTSHSITLSHPLTLSLLNHFHFPGNVLHDIRQGDSYRNKKDELEELGITFYIHKQPRGRQNQTQVQVQLQHQNQSQGTGQGQGEGQGQHEHQHQHSHAHQNMTSSSSTYITDNDPTQTQFPPQKHDTGDVLLPHPSVSQHLTNHHTTNAVSASAPQSFNCFMDEIVSLV
jgi:hypothetical protein